MPSPQSLPPAQDWTLLEQEQPANDTMPSVDRELMAALASLEGDGLMQLQFLESENCRLLGQLTRRRLERP